MFEIFFIITPLFLIIFFIAFLRHFNLITGEWTSSLNQYILRIGFPILIFSSLVKTDINVSEEIRLIITNLIFLSVIFFVSYVIGQTLNLSRSLKKTIVVCLMFSNVAYLGMPLLTNIYGDGILPQISIIVAVYLLSLFGIGVTYLEITRHNSTRSIVKIVLKNLITNPILIAVFCGIIFNVAQIPIPSLITRSMDMITVSVTPIVLVIIGNFIGASSLGKLRDWVAVGIFTLGTLILVPLTFYIGALLFHHTPSDHTISILESAMPLGITPFAFADHYGLDKHFIARTIVLSTVLSIITLPFWISVLS
jgi:predicted permease